MLRSQYSVKHCHGACDPAPACMSTRRNLRGILRSVAIVAHEMDETARRSTHANFVYLENIRQNQKNPNNPKNLNLRIDLAMMVIDDFRRSPQVGQDFVFWVFFVLLGLGQNFLEIENVCLNFQ